jgi:hypothetical protein
MAWHPEIEILNFRRDTDRWRLIARQMQRHLDAGELDERHTPLLQTLNGRSNQLELHHRQAEWLLDMNDEVTLVRSWPTWREGSPGVSIMIRRVHEHRFGMAEDDEDRIWIEALQKNGRDRIRANEAARLYRMFCDLELD